MSVKAKRAKYEGNAIPAMMDESETWSLNPCDRKNLEEIRKEFVKSFKDSDVRKETKK